MNYSTESEKKNKSTIDKIMETLVDSREKLNEYKFDSIIEDSSNLSDKMISRIKKHLSTN